MSLINEFRLYLNQAIDDYEEKFSGNHRMSEQRARDVISLRAITNNETLEATELREALIIYLEQIKTGWWKINTGRSKLRDYLNEILINQRYSEINLLKDQIRILKLRSAENNESSDTEMPKIIDMNAEFQTSAIASNEKNYESLDIETESRNDCLTAEIVMSNSIPKFDPNIPSQESLQTMMILKQENARLRKCNKELFEKNALLISENTKLRKGEIETADSPTNQLFEFFNLGSTK